MMIALYVALYIVLGYIVSRLFKANIKLTEDDMIIALPFVTIAWPLLIVGCVVSLLLSAIAVILIILRLAADAMYDIFYQKVR